MKIKKIVFNGIFWRGLYFVTVLLLNIVVSRYFQATGSGWIYYVTNYFSLILLVASLSLESGMTFYSSSKGIAENKLAGFGILWSIAVTALIAASLFLLYHRPVEGLTVSQFVFFAVVYAFGVLLTSFFCALFYARQNYTMPNVLLSSCNVLVVFIIIISARSGIQVFSGHFLLQIYFLNFLLQGVVLAIAYLVKENNLMQLALPAPAELRLLFRYSLLAFFNNLLFFLLYRIDFFFVKNICSTCAVGDLGNYIQVSKTVQLFLVLPVIIASAIFPLTASGQQAQVNNGLPVLARSIVVLYIAVLGLLAVTGRWLFPWVFGDSFNQMYTPFILLIPGIFALSTIALLTAYYSGKNKMAINLKGLLIGLVIIFVGDWLFIPKYGIAAAALVSSTGYIGYLMSLLYTYKKEYKLSPGIFFIPVKEDLQRLRQIFSSHDAN